MATYLVRVPAAASQWDYGVFLAATIPELALAVDEWCDPNGAEYVRITSGVWFDRDDIANGVHVANEEAAPGTMCVSEGDGALNWDAKEPELRWRSLAGQYDRLYVKAQARA